MSEITNDLVWLKTHVILLIIVIVLTFGGVYGVESIIAKHDASNAAALNAIQKSLTDKLNADEKRWDDQNSAQQTLITNLSNAITQRDKTLADVIQKDATLTATQSATKIADATKAKAGEVTSSGDTVTVDLPIARTITTNLDQLPVLQQDLVDTKQQLASETIIADNRQELIDEMKKNEVAADNTCKANISNVKAQARKSKLKFFALGYLLGIVSAHFIGI
jgi:hypothetical protein